jgi:hypothetical protein
MVLNVKQYKHCNFYLGRGAMDFIILLVLGQSNGPLPKKIIKTFVFWDAQQII